MIDLSDASPEVKANAEHIIANLPKYLQHFGITVTERTVFLSWHDYPVKLMIGGINTYICTECKTYMTMRPSTEELEEVMPNTMLERKRQAYEGLEHGWKLENGTLVHYDHKGVRHVVVFVPCMFEGTPNYLLHDSDEELGEASIFKPTSVKEAQTAMKQIIEGERDRLKNYIDRLERRQQNSSLPDQDLSYVTDDEEEDTIEPTGEEKYRLKFQPWPFLIGALAAFLGIYMVKSI